MYTKLHLNGTKTHKPNWWDDDDVGKDFTKHSSNKSSSGDKSLINTLLVYEEALEYPHPESETVRPTHSIFNLRHD